MKKRVHVLFCLMGPPTKSYCYIFTACFLLVCFSLYAAETKSVQVNHRISDFEKSKRNSSFAFDRKGVALSSNINSASLISPIIENEFPFNAVGPHWLVDLPEGSSIDVYIRVSSDGQNWSKWILSPEDEEPVANFTEAGRPNPFAGDRVGTLVFVNPDNRFVQYRVDFKKSDNSKPFLRRISLNLINSTEGPTIEEIVKSNSEILITKSSSSVPKPRIFKRSEWAARPPKASYQLTTAGHLCFHHTAGASEWDVQDWDDCAARVRAIQNFHMDTRGWNDIGYNYTICKFGHIFQAREDDNDAHDVHAAHDGFNRGSMGVSSMGYFHPPYNQNPTPELLNALYRLFAWKCDERSIDPHGRSLYAAFGAVRDHIYGHREVRATACPGDILFAQKAAIKDSVAQIISDFTTGVDEASDSSPESFALLQSYPNPFAITHDQKATSVRISFHLQRGEQVRLSIYNALGQEIRVLDESFLSAGSHIFYWDQKDQMGRNLSAGLYFYRLKTMARVEQKKLLLVN